MKIIEAKKLINHLMLNIKLMHDLKQEAIGKKDREWTSEINRELITYCIILDWARENTKEINYEPLYEPPYDNQRSHNKVTGLPKRRRNTNSSVGLSNSQ